MDRSTQVIAVLLMLLIGVSASAQKKRGKGLQAYPVYHLQGLEFKKDSTLLGLYRWIQHEERSADLSADTGAAIFSLDTLAAVDTIQEVSIIESNAVVDSVIIREEMSLDSIYYWEDFYDFDPDGDSVDSVMSDSGALDLNRDSIMVDSLPLEPVLADSLSIDGIPSDSLSLLTEPAILDSIEDPIQIDSLLVPQTQDSLGFKVKFLLTDSISSKASSIILLENDILIDTLAKKPEVDSIPIRKGAIPRDSIQAPIPLNINANPKDTSSSILDSSGEKFLIKSDPSVLGGYNLERPVFDDSAIRRRLLKTKETDSPVTDSKTRDTDRVHTVISERVIEKPLENTGPYTGLSKAEGERQLRLDAESRRRLDAAQLALDERKFEADLERESAVSAADSLEGQKASELKESVNSPDRDQNFISHTPTNRGTTENKVVTPVIVEKHTEPVVVLQRDTLTEKAVEELADRLDKQARKDSMNRVLESTRIDARFDRMESKMDTLLNALGKRVVLDKAVYSIPKEEMNIYFAINSHSIPVRQLMGLEKYIGQLNDLSGFRVVLSGYADNSGDMEYNRMLVEKRIAAVKQAILTMGVPPAEILVNNYGKQKARTQKRYNQLDRKVSIQIFSAE